jgi:hypothetical protein
MVGGFLWVLLISTTNTTDLPWYSLNIIKSGISKES